MMAKFHKEIPFLHENKLRSIVQVSEWNFNPTSLQMLLIMTVSSESVSKSEGDLRTRLAYLKLSFVM